MTTRHPAKKRRDIKGAARRREILTMLEAHPSGDLSVEEIAQRFGISFATVRRDLGRLGDERGIARTYGGVSLVRPAEVSTRDRQTTHGTAKEAIGRAAATAVSDGDLVIVDAGSTTTQLARSLHQVRDLTVVTNGIGVITALLDAAHAEVLVLGGRLRGINETITGAEAEEMLHRIFAATAFIGTDALDPALGIASRTLPQSRLKTLMMQRARDVVVLADSSKLAGGAYAYWSELDRPWRLITDDEADPADLDRLRRAGASSIEVVPVAAPASL